MKEYKKKTKNYIFRFSYDKEGWWMKLNESTKLNYFFCFGKAVADDGIYIYNIVLWRWFLSIGPLRQFNKNSEMV
jgi:hypothetical protein